MHLMPILRRFASQERGRSERLGGKPLGSDVTCILSALPIWSSLRT